MPIPRFLFRVWTDQSNGTNSPALIASAWRAWHALGKFPKDPGKRLRMLKKKYKDALMGKEVDFNPYVFTTSSLLNAIQHAISNTKGGGEKNAYIIWIDTRTCERADGEPVRFHSAIQKMIDFDMSTPRARWTYEERDYSDVWVTTDRVIPGEGSFYISFDNLKDVGLFKLFPELDVIDRRPKPGLESPVNDLRRLWYRQKRDLPADEITLAAQLAAAFNSVQDRQTCTEVPSHLLAWFIGLKSQRPDGRRLQHWLESHDAHPGSIDPALLGRKSRLPELNRYYQIHDVVRKHWIGVANVKAVDVRVTRGRMRIQQDYYKDSKKKWGWEKSS